MSAATVPPTSDHARGKIIYQNLDHDRQFEESLEHVKNPATRNFLVRYSARDARVAFNLEAQQWDDLLPVQGAAAHELRWINLYAPNLQTETIKIIAKHYDLSPRLLALMCSEPTNVRLNRMSTAQSVTRRRFHGWYRRSTDTKPANGTLELPADPEKAAAVAAASGGEPEHHHHHVDEALDLDHYRLVDELWHYASVDAGTKYLCLGFNTLHGGSKADPDRVTLEHPVRDVPKGKRLWSWLLLCSDGTVISMTEDPFPSRNPQTLSPTQRALLQVIRRNIVNVFRHLSKAHSAAIVRNPLLILHLRSNIELGNDRVSESSEKFVAQNGPSLLFYYLFDDWYSSYGLVTRKEQQYGTILEKLRQQMLQKADLDYVDQLHHVGRELTVLKRMYESYGKIITHILDGQHLRVSSFHGIADLALTDESTGTVAESQKFKMDVSGETSEPLEHSFMTRMTDRRHHFGPVLTAEAITRFERLRDRIQIYALSEIQDCLNEKESMAFMNFNLIAMKESAAVEHLTRITILLAKVTIVFLPVSLMTAYFSTQIEDLHFTAKGYWISFAVIMAISVVFLTVFGILSGTTESKIIYRSLGRRSYDAAKKGFRKVKPKSEEIKTA